MQVPSGRSVQAELNVTPMIDVVLVLLIIFMVVSPKRDQQVPVVVPQEAPADEPAPPSTTPPLVVAVAEDGALSVNGTALTSVDGLPAALEKEVGTRAEKVVFLGAHPEAPFERVVDVMDVARKAGAKHVGLIKELPKPAGGT
ncbi:MAG: biopolymer transporter ExbD [Myxococcota bacterium]